MSLYGALLTGVSALDANSRALAITSSNIANLNTVGYKTSTADFSTFLAGNGFGGEIAPSSVQVSSAQQLSKQGLLTSTGNSTDMALSGNGFFIVTDTPTLLNQADLYTRAGSFTPDASGRLRNAAGFYLKAWQLTPAGNMPANRSSLVPINLSSLNGTAQPTANITLKANLQASTVAVPGYVAGDMTAGNVPPAFEQSINVFDSQGASRPMKLSFVKTGPDTWAYEVAYQGPLSDIGGAGFNPVANGTLTFNADGTLATPVSGLQAFTVPWDPSTGLLPQPLTLKFGTAGLASGVSQFDASSQLTSANIDGAPFGSLSSVSVDDNGFVTALFDNGIEKRVYKIPVATFANPDALAATTGNAYLVTDNSGTPTITEAKTGGAGSIVSNSLEASTSDLAREFSSLITTQRAYSAATRIVTTADQMLQELMQIKN
jgi:flagellar hook protein FlgE